MTFENIHSVLTGCPECQPNSGRKPTMDPATQHAMMISETNKVFLILFI